MWCYRISKVYRKAFRNNKSQTPEPLLINHSSKNSKKSGKYLLEEEINKLLWSDLNSKIEGYEYGMIPLMLAMIRVNNHIDFYAKSCKKGRIH